jgi:hypothetical protein
MGETLKGLAMICLDSEYHDPVATGRRSKATMLYVAGPMSGHPENNYPAFNEAARVLRDAGYGVINPAEFSVHGDVRVHYVDLIREDLRQMLDCHGVAILDGWWESVGARNEITVAGVLKMPVRPVTDWLERSAKELS